MYIALRILLYLTNHVNDQTPSYLERLKNQGQDFFSPPILANKLRVDEEQYQYGCQDAHPAKQNPSNQFIPAAGGDHRTGRRDLCEIPFSGAEPTPQHENRNGYHDAQKQNLFDSFRRRCLFFSKLTEVRLQGDQNAKRSEGQPAQHQSDAPQKWAIRCPGENIYDAKSRANEQQAWYGNQPAKEQPQHGGTANRERFIVYRHI